jgi:hypothetical protein
MNSAEPMFLCDEHSKIFEQTKDIPGWQLPGDSFKLYEMAYESGDVILEIGTFGGRSAVVEIRGALANPARAEAPQFFGIEIDIHGIWRSYNSIKAAGLEKYSLLFHGDLEKFVSEFSVKPTMVFVDGDHRYEGVKKDLLILSRILSPNTPVLCHDYTNPENETGELGVRRAVDEFVEAGFAEFSGNFGCSAFLKTTAKCQGQFQARWSHEEFLEHKARLLEAQGQSMYFSWQTAEARYAEELKRLQATQASPAYQESESAQLRQAQRQLQDIQQQLQDAQRETYNARQQIAAMESSKFWKLRTAWVGFKEKLMPVRRSQ